MKAHSHFDVAKFKTPYWKNSRDAKWEKMAKESYERISKRFK